MGYGSNAQVLEPSWLEFSIFREVTALESLMIHQRFSLLVTPSVWWV